MNKFLQLLLLTPLAAALIGCAGSGGDVDLLKMENAQLCEEIVKLEVQLAEQQMLVQESRPRSTPSSLRLPSTSGESRPAVTSGSPSDDPADFAIPEIDLGSPSNLPRTLPEPEDGAQFISPSDLRVTQITLDERRTQGLDVDEAPGDEGIQISLEPRNAAGQVVPVAGDITVAAWDAELLAAAGDDPVLRKQAHVGLWQLTPEEVAGVMNPTRGGPKFDLRLPWQEDRPQCQKLQVFVRYRTATGKKLQVDAPIDIRLTGSRREWLTAEGDTIADIPGPQIEPAGEEPSADQEEQPQLAEESPEEPTRTASAPKPRRPLPQWSPYR